MKVIIYDMDQNGFDNNAQLHSENGSQEEFGDGYTIIDFYSDNVNVYLDEIHGLENTGWYTYIATDPDTLEETRRYVFCEIIEA